MTYPYLVSVMPIARAFSNEILRSVRHLLDYNIKSGFSLPFAGLSDSRLLAGRPPKTKLQDLFERAIREIPNGTFSTSHTACRFGMTFSYLVPIMPIARAFSNEILRSVQHLLDYNINQGLLLPFACLSDSTLVPESPPKTKLQYRFKPAIREIPNGTFSTLHTTRKIGMTYPYLIAIP